LLAFAETRKQRPNLSLVLAGEGEDRERLQKLRDHLGLNGAVRFAGDVREMPSLLAASDLFCHPSLADGFPNALAEAMAMGLGVIASRVGGVPDVLRHNANGRLVEPHDIHGLVREISDLADHPERRLELGEEARRDAHALLDFDQRSAAWLRLMEEEEARFRHPATRRIAPPAVRKTNHPVLFVLSTLRTGGEETEVALLARYLNRKAYPLSVLSLHEVPEASPAKARIEQLGVRIDTVCHGLASAEEKALYLERKILGEGVRVVVACQDVAIAHAAMQRIPEHECALVEHAGIVEEVARVAKNRTARLIGVSPAIRDAAAPLFAERSHAAYLPSMVDLAEYDHLDRETLRRELGFGGETVVLFVGRLDAKKGIDDLIEAARMLLPRLPELRFLIVGPADAFQRDYAKRLMQRAYALFTPQRFTFTGARNDIPALLKAADIVVLPSRGEGMSHVINEAGAARTPVIAYEDGAAREQLCGGDAGVLVPPGDIAALTLAIERLALDSGERFRLGERHWLHVFRNYSAQRVIEQWHELLGEVCAPLPKSAAPAMIRRHVTEELDFPAEIQVETNTACNATCIMCPYPEVSKELPQGRMPLEMYDGILRQCEGQRHLWRIEPFLNNEPFTDTRMCEILARTKERLPKIMLTVTTNGSLLFPKVTDQLVKTGLDGIWFSFNGATKETYEHIMGLKFDVVKRNIDYLLDVKPDSLRVFTNMIETERMRGEIEENIRYWQSRGVQSGSSPLVNRAGNVKNFVELNYKTVAPKPVRLCDLLYRKMYIGYNGDALLCCMDWRRKVVLGNVSRQSIREIWQGEPYRHYRRLHEQGRVAELALCNDCTYVQN
ncbi:MAG: glycosyltransferase, partial [Bryobacterales bacterium]|nr:glycosyltransferase [Bryobacterales bacterium]